VIVRWKPSTRSRSLSDISSLASLARIGVAQTTPLPAVAGRLASLDFRALAHCVREDAASTSHPSSPPGRYLWGRPPNVSRRVGRCDVLSPGGLKGRGPVAVSEANGVASATPIRASAALCGCPSADMSLSDRELRGATRFYCERGAQRLASGPRAFIALRRLRLRSHRFQLASGPKAFNAHTSSGAIQS